MSFIIMTDTNSDIPFTYVDQYDLPVVPMPYVLNGEEKVSDLGRDSAYKAFFAAMRGGSVPTTSLVSMPEYLDILRPIFDKGQDVLYIAFSTNMSQTHRNALEAWDTVLKGEFPNQRFEMFDTRTISLAEALIVLKALKLRDEEGYTIDALLNWLKEHYLEYNAWLAVEDLKYLRRGGRISGASAAMGTVLDIKPILTIDATGIVVPFEKVKGNRRAMRTLVDHTVERIADPEGEPIAIMHGDCEAEAQQLAAMIRERLTVGEMIIVPIGQTVGAHCGPGTLAVCFRGKPRT